jgi:hypothetical protein
MTDKSDEQLANEISAWLDTVDPATLDVRDAKHFRRIIRAREQLDAAQAEIVAAVAAAREAGDSWTIIGAALGVSRQAAWERFGKRAG